MFDKDELFASENLSYLDYIVGNWNKLKLLLQDKGTAICGAWNVR